MIRKAQEKDVLRIFELLTYINELHFKNRPDIFKKAPKYQIADLKAMIKDQDCLLIVCLDEDDYLLAYGIAKIKRIKETPLLKERSYLYIDDLCVDPKFQGKHLGQKVMDEMIKKAKDMDLDSIELNVYAFNSKAKGFYERYGFKDQKVEMELNLKSAHQ